MLLKSILIQFFLLWFSQAVVSEITNYTFPDGFLFGVATSAYQIEGAWNEGGKGENVWDNLIHNNSSCIVDGSNGDIACDSYHKWQEDIKLIKNLGVNFYRFSISWTRILPLGYKGSRVNLEGVEYYDKIINALLSEGIEPHVTIFHWDTPQTLEENGGWLNETIIDHYIYYARLLFQLYGDRVKLWYTFNEIHQICEEGYSTGEKAPFKHLEGTGGYQCYHQCAIAHGKIYRIYEKEFKPIQKGKIGIVIDAAFSAPLTDSDSDRRAAKNFMIFNYDMYAHPILKGNYPEELIKIVDQKSKEQNLTESRLPKFTEDEIDMIKGSFDILGLNHYSTYYCYFDDNKKYPSPSQKDDCGAHLAINATWRTSESFWLYEVPWGMRGMLNYIRENYNNPPVLITENGWSEADLKDDGRIDYYQKYLAEVLKAVYEDGCNVFGFTAWSLMDNFEWADGYTCKFGLIHVDFESPNRTRTPRASYEMYRQIIATHRLPIN